jgi:hypothetical protein
MKHPSQRDQETPGHGEQRARRIADNEYAIDVYNAADGNWYPLHLYKDGKENGALITSNERNEA